MRKWVRAQDKLTRERPHHTGPGPCWPPQGGAQSVMERLGVGVEGSVNALIKWGNGGLEVGGTLAQQVGTEPVQTVHSQFRLQVL